MKPEDVSIHKPSLHSGAAHPVGPSQVQLAEPIGQAHGTPTGGQIWQDGGRSSSAFGSAHSAVQPTNGNTPTDTPDITGLTLGVAQTEETTTTEPSEFVQPMLPIDVPVLVRESNSPVAGRRVWVSVPVGQISDAHFFKKNGNRAVATPVQVAKQEQATAYLNLVKIALEENGYPEATNASTMMEYEQLGEGLANLALILVSEVSAEKANPTQEPPNKSVSDKCESDGNDPQTRVHLKDSVHGSESAETAKPDEVQLQEGMSSSVLDKDMIQATSEVKESVAQEVVPEREDKPSVADVAAAVFECVMSPATDDLIPQDETQVKLSEVVTKGVDTLRDQHGGKKMDRPFTAEVDGKTCAKAGAGVWPKNPPAEPAPPTYRTVEVTCNGFKFNERVVYLNEVSANKLTGKKIEAYFTQGMHLDLIRECAGRPDRLLNAYLREETYKKKEVCYLERLELIEDDGEFTLTEA